MQVSELNDCLEDIYEILETKNDVKKKLLKDLKKAVSIMHRTPKFDDMKDSLSQYLADNIEELYFRYDEPYDEKMIRKMAETISKNARLEIDWDKAFRKAINLKKGTIMQVSELNNILEQALEIITEAKIDKKYSISIGSNPLRDNYITTAAHFNDDQGSRRNIGVLFVGDEMIEEVSLGKAKSFIKKIIKEKMQYFKKKQDEAIKELDELDKEITLIAAGK